MLTTVTILVDEKVVVNSEGFKVVVFTTVVLTISVEVACTGLKVVEVMVW